MGAAGNCSGSLSKPSETAGSTKAAGKVMDCTSQRVFSALRLCRTDLEIGWFGRTRFHCISMGKRFTVVVVLKGRGQSNNGLQQGSSFRLEELVVSCFNTTYPRTQLSLLLYPTCKAFVTHFSSPSSKSIQESSQHHRQAVRNRAALLLQPTHPAACLSSQIFTQLLI